ncbi:hypothetical protein DY000_02032997 [Brassica cretica]|uniref:Uncharacterized protein n=1 Tax=Brassica cretica TaxID=69181 RepID=A0ABQ7DU07_BRACR|nr:hypothetical protein DY000_02032997 [Brassica cretica]
MVPDLEEVRPYGVKACKAAKLKKHGKEAVYDKLQSMLAVKQNISKQKLLDRFLAKKDTLSDIEVSLKNKLVTGCTCLLVGSTGHGFYLATVFMFLSTCVLGHGFYLAIVLMFLYLCFTGKV